jgi:flagellar motor switch protein FliN/FliY
MYIEDVLRLGVGSVVELDKLAGDPVDIFVNDRLVARGEVLVLNENFCVRINDILSPAPGVESTR